LSATWPNRCPLGRLVKFTEAEDEMFESLWGDEPSGKVLRELRKAVRKNRKELLAEWEAKVNQ
jgi:hypothetical protein